MSETKQRPILFSGAMVQAILGGHKTQTRRVMKPVCEIRDALAWHEETTVGLSFAKPGYWRANVGGSSYTGRARCPYGVPGDRLWVRETWRADTDWVNPHNLSSAADIRYAADGDAVGQHWVDIPEAARKAATAMLGKSVDGQDKRRWHPSIHMPRWASRLTLEVVKVRVERLQEISVADCRAEGCNGGNDSIPGYEFSATPREHYKHLWDSINGKTHPWHSNPWVWVVEFSIEKAAE